MTSSRLLMLIYALTFLALTFLQETKKAFPRPSNQPHYDTGRRGRTVGEGQVKMEAGTRPQRVDVDKLIDDRPISALQLRVIVLCASLVFLDGYDIQTLAVSVNWLSSEWH